MTASRHPKTIIQLLRDREVGRRQADIVGTHTEVTPGGGGGAVSDSGDTTADTVVSEAVVPGKNPTPGTRTDKSRGDHEHGTFAVPMFNATPARSETLPAGYSAVLAGLPLTLNAGITFTIETGAVLTTEG